MGFAAKHVKKRNGGNIEKNMDKRAFKTLEFDKILKRMSLYTDSDETKKRILDLEPYTELSAAQTAQRETAEAVSAMLKMGSPPVNLAVKDVRGAVKRVEMGGAMSAAELIGASRILYVARRMQSYIGDASANESILSGIAENIVTAKAVEDKINAAIISEDEIADDASPDLSAIRRKIRNLNGKIKDSLNDMIRSAHYKKYLQDPIVTMRADRYVIPVRAEYRSEIKGIVHDSSASGATLFIEPMSVVSANNEIRDLTGREQAEIERILMELSAAAAENSGVIAVDYEVCARLDFIFCKARLALDMNATEPILNDEGIIYLKKARHPLIANDVVVANDVMLGEGYDTLVITGPNTGGKTVTLKTIGLFSLMAAAGLHLPVQDESRAAVFSQVFADIGDEQSIEQSLSTFSSHMVNIVRILERIDESSLALFDELGAGTDPTEGAALAVAVLEHLRRYRVTTAATTHYSELKLFALSTAGVENASCEFDVHSLKPTYKLLIGVPGKSNAFAISRRLGLDERVIDRANELLSDENVKFEDVITDLEQSRVKARSEREYAERMRRELADLKSELDKERSNLKERKSTILDEAHREAKIIVMDAKDEANKIIRELEHMRQKGAQSFDGAVKKAKNKLKEREDTIDEAMAKASKPRKIYTEPPKDLKKGTSVKIVSMKQDATVLNPPNKDGMVRVRAGIITMDVHITNLKRIDDSREKSKQMADKYVRNTRAFESRSKNVSPEVDLRGQMPEEAVMNAEKFLDDCYLAGISPVTIIHGKGTGVLRSAVQSMLRKHRYVQSFRNGKYGEGEMGVTVVELK